MTSKKLSLDSIIDELNQAFENGKHDEEIKAVLSKLENAKEDWEPYAIFDEKKPYTRNLVTTNKNFTLMLLCWNPEQKSPIHDHAGSECWLRVMDGQLSEKLYDMVDGCPKLREANVVDKDGIAYIRDDIGVHSMGAANGVPACSLHCYAPPFEKCQVFEEETGKAQTRRMTFYSEYGAKKIY